jgi:hypothetical protein
VETVAALTEAIAITRAQDAILERTPEQPARAIVGTASRHYELVVTGVDAAHLARAFPALACTESEGTVGLSGVLDESALRGISWRLASLGCRLASVRTAPRQTHRGAVSRVDPPDLPRQNSRAAPAIHPDATSAEVTLRVAWAANERRPRWPSRVRRARSVLRGCPARSGPAAPGDGGRRVAVRILPEAAQREPRWMRQVGFNEGRDDRSSSIRALVKPRVAARAAARAQPRWRMPTDHLSDSRPGRPRVDVGVATAALASRRARGCAPWAGQDFGGWARQLARRPASA